MDPMIDSHKECDCNMDILNNTLGSLSMRQNIVSSPSTPRKLVSAIKLCDDVNNASVIIN